MRCQVSDYSLHLLLLDRVILSYDADIDIQQLLYCLNQDLITAAVADFTYSGRILRRKGQIVVGNCEEVQHEILDLFHGSTVGGIQVFMPLIRGSA